ncbi:MAG TPA: XRE family transcriptional regulator [Chryseosolibacter sp.]|nr:XRE family transcriptional regulator [Chryseosolibacter sp.]
MKHSKKKAEPSYAKTLQRIGEKVTELRIQKGYDSRQDFAEDHDLPHIQYWRIEKGLANLTFKSLNRVLEIHGMTIEDIFEDLLSESKSSKKTKARAKRTR